MNKAIPVSKSSGIFEEFIEQHDGLVHHLVAEKVPYADVPDVVQEVYARIAQSINTFQGDSKLETWISKIIRNTISIYFRQRNRLMDTHTDLTLEGHLPEVPSLPIMRADIRKALHFLPDSYREVLIMRFWQDMNLSEIARVLDMRYEAVRSRYRRGIAFCRKNMVVVADEFIGDKDIEIEWTGTQVKG